MVRLRVPNNPERFMFNLHRWTGIILLIYFTTHAIVMGLTFVGVQGAARLASYMLANKLVLWIAAITAVFHGANGIRLIIAEALGLGVGKPEVPRPPYISKSLRSSQRLLMHVLYFLALIAASIATYIILLM